MSVIYKKVSGLGSFGPSLVGCTWILVLFNIFLVGWMILLSFKKHVDVFNKPLTLPDVWSWFNYTEALALGDFGEAILNTVLLSFSASILTILIAAPAAYALSRINIKHAGTTLVYFAMGIAIPAQLIIMPLYHLMMTLGMLDSLWGLLVIYIASGTPFSVFFLAAFFSSLDSELEEAATIDGASAFYTFWKIMLPLARSGIITLFILNLIGSWNETLFALIFLQSDDKVTLSLALLRFIEQIEFGSGAGWGGLFAGITIVVLPMLLIYIWAGSRIIEGLTLGSGK